MPAIKADPLWPSLPDTGIIVLTYFGRRAHHEPIIMGHKLAMRTI
jgi:hypothetical protein